MFVHDYFIESMAGASDVRRSPFGNTLLTAPSRPPRNAKAIDVFQNLKQQKQILLSQAVLSIMIQFKWSSSEGGQL